MTYLESAHCRGACIADPADPGEPSESCPTQAVTNSMRAFLVADYCLMAHCLRCPSSRAQDDFVRMPGVPSGLSGDRTLVLADLIALDHH